VSAAEFLPERRDLAALRRAAAGCRGCDLWRDATATVFGEGPAGAEVVLLGEQPGDREDIEGHPFVGPAGQLLDRALERAGLARDRAYLTNAVKHFRHERRGKRRIHKSPTQTQIVACGPWFAAELDALTPRVLVLLGAVAGRAVFGPDFRVTRQRGRLLEGPNSLPTMATAHPSSILRARDDDREQAMEQLVADLTQVAELLRTGRS
jgi:uracil-DNA glycosylase family protein